MLKIKLIFLPQLCIVLRQHPSDKCTVHTFSLAFTVNFISLSKYIWMEVNSSHLRNYISAPQWAQYNLVYPVTNKRPRSLRPSNVLIKTKSVSDYKRESWMVRMLDLKWRSSWRPGEWSCSTNETMKTFIFLYLHNNS